MDNSHYKNKKNKKNKKKKKRRDEIKFFFCFHTVKHKNKKIEKKKFLISASHTKN